MKPKGKQIDRCANCNHVSIEGLCWHVEGDNFGHVTEVSENYWCINYEKQDSTYDSKDLIRKNTGASGWIKYEKYSTKTEKEL